MSLYSTIHTMCSHVLAYEERNHTRTDVVRINKELLPGNGLENVYTTAGCSVLWLAAALLYQGASLAMDLFICIPR